MLNLDPVTQTESLGRSAKYVHINTAQFEEVLQDHGLFKQRTWAANSKKRAGFQPHLSTWSYDALRINKHNQVEIGFLNSHDGTTSAKFDLRVWRLVCSNGLVAPQSQFTKMVRHTGDALEQVNQAIKYLIERAPQVAAEVELLGGKQLYPTAFDTLVSHALKLRTSDTVLRFKRPEPKRSYDIEPDAWTQFNVVQEHLIKGGLQYMTLNEKGAPIWKKTRALSNIQRTTELNKQLWAETLRLAV